MRTIAIGLWVIALVLIVRAYCILTPQSSIPKPYRSLYQEVLSPVVKVQSLANTGSGVVISTETGKTYLLTAAHLVLDARTVQVYLYKYQYELPVITLESASVVITDTDKDLALLEIKHSRLLTYPSARLVSKDYTPYLFTEVYAVGCSLGLNPRPSEGIITAISSEIINPSWEISAPILPGNSGGGVFLKDTHELIGITVWIRASYGQLVPTMAGIVPINQIYEFLKTTPLMNCEEHKSEGLTCWSGWGSECAIGTRGPGWLTLLTKGGEKVMTPSPQLVSKARFVVPIPNPPVQRIITKWVDKLKAEAPVIFEKIFSRLPDEGTFQTLLAEVSSKGYQPVLDEDFVSRAGLTRDRIVANQLSNLKRSWNKFRKKLEHVFETVDTVEAKRFKDLIDLMQDDFAAGVANRTLPFTGTRIEGRGCAPLGTLWLVNDPTVPGLLRGGDEVLFGSPFRVPRFTALATFKAALQGRLVQAGATIIKANLLEDAITEQNDITNAMVNGFRDPLQNIVSFTTGGDSHVDYITGGGDQLLLEVQVTITP